MAHLTLDKSICQAYTGGRTLNLEPKEFDILWLLAEKPGKTFKEKDIFDELKKIHPQLEENPFSKYIHQLRYKLNKNYIQMLDEGLYRFSF